ncbi:hypothetical protein PVAP13_8NG320756 [Panicum virgatum]|uniref:Uncharacterized protein n=1 Tax=Panicum virgatum TaxID=38727 RepID=A0A8T0PBH2_PANVG|nr:hypothetical protein PVAP13_8NG320756 [Panicum virgatum]
MLSVYGKDKFTLRAHLSAPLASLFFPFSFMSHWRHGLSSLCSAVTLSGRPNLDASRKIIKGKKCQFEERLWCMARRIGRDLLPIRSPGGWRKGWIGHVLGDAGLEGGIFVVLIFLVGNCILP